jgi:hypothetical protein
MNMNTVRNITYVVQVNGEVAQAFDTLRKARQFVKGYSVAGLEGTSQVIEIVKVVNIETVVNTYVPQQVTTFVSTNPEEETFDTGLQEN